MASPTDELPVLDYHADARKRMVDSQIRPNKVNDPRLLAAMRSLPRERFVPAALEPLAYSDEDVPLGRGRVLMEPMVLARLLQFAAPQDGERALVVGAGTGFGAAVLSQCGPQVTALEEDPVLLDLARGALAAEAPAVRLVSGPLSAGWPGGAPYDIIVIEGAVHAVPPAIAAQLKEEGGRLVTVLTGTGRTAQAILAQRTPGGLVSRPVFDCATPALPSLRPIPEFVF